MVDAADAGGTVATAVEVTGVEVTGLEVTAGMPCSSPVQAAAHSSAASATISAAWRTVAGARSNGRRGGEIPDVGRGALKPVTEELDPIDHLFRAALLTEACERRADSPHPSSRPLTDDDNPCM